MSNKSGTLYTVITNDLERRVYQHKSGVTEGFTKKYRITHLLYFETTGEVTEAISREKQIKGMLKSKKIELIKTMNPQLKDLSEEWLDEKGASTP
jgi:putative endonuclease